MDKFRFHHFTFVNECFIYIYIFIIRQVSFTFDSLYCISRLFVFEWFVVVVQMERVKMEKNETTELKQFIILSHFVRSVRELLKKKTFPSELNRKRQSEKKMNSFFFADNSTGIDSAARINRNKNNLTILFQYFRAFTTPLFFSHQAKHTLSTSGGRRNTHIAHYRPTIKLKSILDFQFNTDTRRHVDINKIARTMALPMNFSSFLFILRGLNLNQRSLP